MHSPAGAKNSGDMKGKSVPLAVSTMTAGLVVTSFLYACAARPVVLSQPLTPLIVQPIEPAPTPTPGAHLVKASWYGPGLAWRKTTSGETFNPRALTAASRALPIGSVVKVTNPPNGKSVSVRINDRGPFVLGRSLDLSRRAAEKLGIIHMGVASVKVTKTSSQADISSAP